MAVTRLSGDFAYIIANNKVHNSRIAVFFACDVGHGKEAYGTEEQVFSDYVYPTFIFYYPNRSMQIII